MLKLAVLERVSQTRLTRMPYGKRQVSRYPLWVLYMKINDEMNGEINDAGGTQCKMST